MSAECEMFEISFDFSTMHHVVNKVCYYRLGWQARPPFCNTLHTLLNLKRISLEMKVFHGHLDCDRDAK